MALPRAGALGGQFGRYQPPAPSRREQFAHLRRRAVGFDLVADLGLDIGSPRWWRGLATCAVLCLALAGLAPNLEAIEVPAPRAMADAQWDEARALALSPLAYGADTGARMAATPLVEPLMHAPERPTVDLLATWGQGDSLSRVLERAGVGRGEAAAAEALVAGQVNLAAIDPGTTLDLTLGRRAGKGQARPLERLQFRARMDLNILVERRAGALAVRALPIAVDANPLRIQGRVGPSLYHSARAAGAPPAAVAAYIRALSSQLSIGTGIGVDDRFDIILAHRRAQTGEAEAGDLLYAGLERVGGKPLQLLKWSQGGRNQWFEASGVGRTTGTMRQPVAGFVTSGFGMRRHPILGFARMHRGIDFAAGYGAPIYAATDGRVERAGWSGGYGKQVRINHAGGLATSYSHMSRIVTASGAAVRAGQVIGYVGSTGLSTGPHLHYELYRSGVPINPRSVSFVSRSLLEGTELAVFRQKLAGLLAVRPGAKT